MLTPQEWTLALGYAEVATGYLNGLLAHQRLALLGGVVVLIGMFYLVELARYAVRTRSLPELKDVFGVAVLGLYVAGVFFVGVV